MKKLFLILLFIPIVLLFTQVTLAQDCDCIYNGECFTYETQRVLPDGIFYCNLNGEVFPVKFSGEICESNYECGSFYCDSTCGEIKLEKDLNILNNNFIDSLREFNYFFLLMPFIVIILVIALMWFIYSLSHIKTIKNKKDKSIKQTNKIKYVKRNIKKDELEENLKKSMKKVNETFKKDK